MFDEWHVPGCGGRTEKVLTIRGSFFVLIQCAVERKAGFPLSWTGIYAIVPRGKPSKNKKR
jgi:hypothetical protein